MASVRPINRLWLILQLAAALLVIRVTLGIVWGYGNYFPPDFFSEFLVGRRDYFYGSYQIAFWVHIFSSPPIMFSGLWLLSGSQRRRHPKVHRQLGRVHTLLVIFLVGPSGLWMSFYALTGWWAGSAFALSSVATILCAALGWRCAARRRFPEHQAWMTRCYLLLCSAILLRVLSGIATVLNSDELFTYPAFAWISAILPVTIYEVGRRQRGIVIAQR